MRDLFQKDPVKTLGDIARIGYKEVEYGGGGYDAKGPRQEDTSLLDLSIQIMIFAALALGLNIVVGLAGLLDLGYVAFFAVGAYVWGIFASPRFGEILRYYGENPGATNAGTLALGLFLTAVTAASLLYIQRRHRAARRKPRPRGRPT